MARLPSAEPISAFCEVGKIRMGGLFRELEDELCSFTTYGFQGDNSPNRADAMVWGMSDLFPELAKPEAKKEPEQVIYRRNTGTSWMRNL